MQSKSAPQGSAHPMYLALKQENIENFNARRTSGETVDLSGMDFRGLDLRGADLKGLDLSNGHFRQTDLRGLDLRTCNLAGASIRAAKISGTYFPEALAPEEILMSLNYGTRMRYR